MKVVKRILEIRRYRSLRIEDLGVLCASVAPSTSALQARRISTAGAMRRGGSRSTTSNLRT